MYWTPPSTGWVIARPETHAVLFLTPQGAWSDHPGDAKVLASPLQAREHIKRHPGSEAMSMDMLEWIKGPKMRVVQGLVRR